LEMTLEADQQRKRLVELKGGLKWVRRRFARRRKLASNILI